MVVAIVECMFLRRIYTLSNQSLFLTLPLGLLIGVQLGFGVIGASLGLTPQPFASAVGGQFASVRLYSSLELSLNELFALDHNHILARQWSDCGCSSCVSALHLLG